MFRSYGAVGGPDGLLVGVVIVASMEDGRPGERAKVAAGTRAQALPAIRRASA